MPAVALLLCGVHQSENRSAGGMSQPPKSTMRAPIFRCSALSGVVLSVDSLNGLFFLRCCTAYAGLS